MRDRASGTHKNDINVSSDITVLSVTYKGGFVEVSFVFHILDLLDESQISFPGLLRSGSRM